MTRTGLINQALKTFIPTKIIYPCKRNKPWFNNELKTLIRKRTRYYKRWRKTNDMNCKRLYSKLRNLIQRKIKLAKHSYNMSYINKLNTTNTSHADYWSSLNQFWKPNKQCNYPITLNGKPVHDEYVKCNLFNEYFA